MNNYFHKFLRAASLVALVGMASGNMAAREHWHVYDALGNTVVSVNADAIVASIESTAFGESRAPTAGVRFTGKPYDADLGAHVFPFRNYRSDVGRWTSADPCGFPDGANGQAYAPVPVSNIDPLGLSEETYQNGNTYRHIEGYPDSSQTSGALTMTIVGNGAHLVNNDSGLFEVNFSVSSGITSGWVVQHIVASGMFYTDEYDTIGQTHYYDYWEMWEVLINGMVNLEGLDKFVLSPVGFAGSFVGTGYAKYISTSDIGTGSNPNSWSLGSQVPGSLAGDLKSTTTAPSWWSDAGAITHGVYFSWYE